MGRVGRSSAASGRPPPVGRHAPPRAASPVVEGGTLTVDFEGLPGETALILYSVQTGFQPLPSKGGVLQVGGAFIVMPIAALPASGTLSLDVPIGELGPAAALNLLDAQF